jgi:iron complex outermembrane receptor protein
MGLIGALLICMLARAQAQTLAAVQPETQGKQGLEEVVVTAQKKQESLQQVPIAVTAVSPQQLESARIADLQDLQIVTPSLTYNTNATYARAYIRGIGTPDSNPGLETSVATYVDDVYVYRQLGAIYDMMDQRDIEVLKGPQGALYGKNATGGAILMYSANPTDRNEGMLKADYGRFNRQEYEVLFNIPLTDTLKVRVAGRRLSQDGYIANSLGNEEGGQRGTMARVKVDWTPLGWLDVLASSDWSNTFLDANIHQERLPPPLCVACLVYGFTPPVANSYSDNESIVPSTHVQYAFHNLRTTVDLPFAKLTSITAYRQQKWDGTYDNDFTPATFEHFHSTESAYTVSESVRLASDTKSWLDYLIGVDWDQDNGRFWSNIFGDAFAPLPGIKNLSHVISRSTSVYGELYWRFLPEWQLTLGARYNRDSKQFYGNDDPYAQLAFGGYPAQFTESAKYVNVTPRVVLAYQHDNANYYISYNQGFKSGGLNTPAFTIPDKVNPEKIDSVEVGAKFTFLDGRLKTNIDAFHYNYRGIQVTFTNVAHGGQEVQNAASARTNGIEFDSQFLVLNGLTLSLGADWLHARFTKYPAATCYIPAAVGLSTGNCDLTGAPLPDAPNFNGTIGLTYNFALPGGWPANVSAVGKYTSEYDFNAGRGGPLGLDREPAYFFGTLTGYVEPVRSLRVGFYVNNFTNRFYVRGSDTGATGDFQIPAEPRTYGMSLTYRWGQ